MVVVCEKCETRFHLSDERVPAKGARVRCSRCKHAFFVTPPGGWDLSLPVEPVFAGADVFFQAFCPDASRPGGFALSRGLALEICP